MECWRDRHGKLRVYFRKDRGRRIPLPASIGSDEFDPAYQAALTGQLALRQRELGEPCPKVHCRSHHFLHARLRVYLGSATRRPRSVTPRVSRRSGRTRPPHCLRPDASTDCYRYSATICRSAGRRTSILKLLRILIRHAIDIGWLDHDPSLGIKRPKTEEIRSWTEAEIAVFEQHWPIGTKQRLAFALMLYTGQRRSDVHRMTWADVSDGTIRVVQQKTGRKLMIPLHRDLLAVLAAAERDHVTIINTGVWPPVHGRWLQSVAS